MELDNKSFKLSELLLSRIDELKELKGLKFLIAGGSGFVGRFIKHSLSVIGIEVRTLSRSQSKGDEVSDYDSFITADLREYDVVINLCGRSVLDLLISPVSYHEIAKSRIQPARFLVNQILGQNPEIMYIQASAVGIYDKSTHSNEESGISLADSISKLVSDWEAPAFKLPKFAILRFGTVLGPGSLIFSVLRLIKFSPLSAYLNSSASTPWTAIEDVVLTVSHALKKNIRGPINVVTNNDHFNQLQITLLKQLTNARIFLPIPVLPLKILSPYFSDLLLRDQVITSNYGIGSNLSLDEYLKHVCKRT